MKKLFVFVIALSITILNIVPVSATNPWPSDFPANPNTNSSLTHQVLYYSAAGTYFLRCSNGSTSMMYVYSNDYQEYYYALDGGGTVSYWKLNGTPGSFYWSSGSGVDRRDKIYRSDNIVWSTDSPILYNGEVFWQEVTTLEKINAATSAADMMQVIINNASEIGIDTAKYTVYNTTGRTLVQDRIYAYKPFESLSAVLGAYNISTNATRKRIQLPRDTSYVKVKNNNTTTVKYNVIGDNATYILGASTKTKSTEDFVGLSLLPSVEVEIKLLPGNTGTVTVEVPENQNISISTQEGQDVGTTPIGNIGAPSRDNYSDDIFGEIKYQFAKVAYLFQTVMSGLGHLLSSVGSMGEVMKSSVSWLPEPMIYMLIVGAGVAITTGVLKVIRG